MKYKRRHKLALLIPAHNEELALGALIQSAIAAGQKPADIYVVDDASVDKTGKVARALLDRANVLCVSRGGKARAIQFGVGHFDLTTRYQWIHIADADGVFGQDYFRLFRRGLNRRKHIAAIGFVQSLHGDWISRYRTYEYTWGQTIGRRIQAFLGVIPVMPGPTSCFHSDIFNKLNFTNNTLTEDFDVTLQIYRQGLGKIIFKPRSVIYTQDPLTLGDFINQISRWYRGYFQSLRRHRIITRISRIDYYLYYLSLQTMVYSLFQLAVLPVFSILTGNTYLISILFLVDVLMFSTMVMLSAIISRRLDILTAFPLFYVARFAYMAVFVKSFTEIMLLNKFRKSRPIWETRGRRYRILIGHENA